MGGIEPFTAWTFSCIEVTVELRLRLMTSFVNHDASHFSESVYATDAEFVLPEGGNEVDGACCGIPGTDTSAISLDVGGEPAGGEGAIPITSVSTTPSAEHVGYFSGGGKDCLKGFDLVSFKSWGRSGEGHLFQLTG